MKWGQLNQRAAGAGLCLLGASLQWWASQSLSAAAFGAGLLLLGAGLAELGRHRPGQAFPPAAGWGLALLSVLLLNCLYGSLSFPGHSYLAGLFRSPVLGGKLAQLLLNSLLILWLLSFAQRSFQGQVFRLWPIRKKMGLAFLSSFTISLGLLMIIILIRSLVLDSGLHFDFRNIFNLGALSLTGIACIVLMLFSLLLLSLWLGRGLVQLGLSRQQRLAAIAASLLASVPLMAALPLGISILTGLLILLLYLILLDLFIELDAGSPAWLIIWLGLLAALGAGFFFKYKLIKGSQERLAFAQSLAFPRDSLAEAELEALIKTDTQLLWMAGQASAFTEGILLEEKAGLYLLEVYPYLGKNYRLKWDTAEAGAAGQQLAPGLYFLEPNPSYYTYAIGPYPLGGERPGWLFFRPAIQTLRKSRDEPYVSRGPERVFQELIPGSPARQAPYDFVVAFQGEAVARRGAMPEDKAKPGQWQENGPAAGKWRGQVDSRYAALFYHAPGGYEVAVGENLGGYLKPLSLFSYLFALLLLAALLLFGSSRYIQPFPGTPPELLIGEPSLRHRIQLSVIGLALAAFAFIGLATIAYFRRTAIRYHEERLFETVNVLVRSINLQGTPPADALSLSRLANAHKVDISLYRRDGRLLASSAPFLYRKKWKENQLAPTALKAMEEMGFRPVVLDEAVNGLAYKSVYVALPDGKGDPAFFLQIPYTATDQAMQESVIEFIGALFNFYVFLLLMGGALAIAVANSITRPLAAIGDKLRSFSLGRNEPLEWGSPDEIGNLVEAYNQMITILEESADKLRRSEREGAWREMAKQVAHEIKNPLTPMKLSIQYLQHAQRSDPERAAALIERVTKTLIEQIDGLAHIASEFSNFAKMPKARNEQLVLNEIVASVYLLFTEHQEPAEEIRLSLPEHPIVAFADKAQLARVLTNLIKNAQQAIPEGRPGQIGIQLCRQGGTAVISVTDNGNGIPDEVQARVFQPNFTTKSSGMGLGLAMCKDIIEAAGGRIYFETRAGAGTDFFIELPALALP